MASEWVDLTIGEIADVIGGSTPSTANPSYFDGDIPWLTPKDLSTAHDRYVRRGERNLSAEGLASCSARLLPRNAVLLSTRAPIGYVALAANPIATNQGFRSLVLKDGYDHEFVYYWLKAHSAELERHASGTTFRELSGSNLKRIRIRLPRDIREQRAVAEILGALDDKIELNRRMSETLEAMARALFQSWFVDFDPVRAKAEGRDPGIPHVSADFFPDRFEESELGNIPAAWGVADVYTIANVIYGAPFKSELFNADRVGLPLIRIRDLATHDPKIFTSETHARGHLIRPGDLVVGMDGEFRAYLWRGPEAWLNQRVCSFVPKPGVPRAYLHYSIERLLSFFEESKTGTTVIHLGKADIDTFRVLLPPESLLAAFAAVADPIDRRVVTAAQESRTLAVVRDALLPKLISGEIRVPEAGRMLEAAPA